MNAAELLFAYEGWCDRLVSSDAAARAQKHRLMAASAFAFMRGSYPLWPSRFAALGLDGGPEVSLAAGDLHIENLGTWSAPAGVTFGVNDYDEAGPGNAGSDLVRLVTSVHLACRAGHLAVHPGEVAGLVWHGYRSQSLAAAGLPLEAGARDEDTASLDELWKRAVPAAARFWRHIESLPEEPSPAPPLELAARDLLPDGFAISVLRLRVAGLGSRDRPRLVADGTLDGDRAAFELKPLAPPARSFVAGAPPAVDVSGYRDVVEYGRRFDPGSAPALMVSPEGYVLRRLEPARGRIELAELPRHRDERVLLRAAGAAAAGFHRLSADADVVRAFIGDHGHHLLEASAVAMVSTVEADLEVFRRAVAKGHG